MMGLDYSKFQAIATKDLVQAQALYGDEKASKMKVALSTPYPPASAPGEAPHSRTGALAEGVGSVTMPIADGVFTTIYSERVGGDSQVPWWLEHGTGKMAPRPYMGPEVIDTARNGVHDIAQHARGAA